MLLPKRRKFVGKSTLTINLLVNTEVRNPFFCPETMSAEAATAVQINKKRKVSASKFIVVSFLKLIV